MKKNMYLIVTLALLFLCGCGAKTSYTSTYLSNNEHTSVSENEINYKSDLVYYGEPAIWREKGDIMVIDLTNYNDFEHIVKVCVRNCVGDLMSCLPFDLSLCRWVDLLPVIECPSGAGAPVSI